MMILRQCEFLWLWLLTYFSKCHSSLTAARCKLTQCAIFMLINSCMSCMLMLRIMWNGNDPINKFHLFSKFIKCTIDLDFTTLWSNHFFSLFKSIIFFVYLFLFISVTLKVLILIVKINNADKIQSFYHDCDRNT